MRKFLFSKPDEYRQVNLPDDEITTNDLPIGVYEYQIEETMMGLHTSFKVLPNFTEPSKYYGNLVQNAEHMTRFYKQNQDKNLGILLYGMSGTGKSLLARKLCVMFQEQNLPVIILNRDTIKYITNCLDELNQPVVFFLDEFEKMFNGPSEQGFLLSVLDGIYNRNHVFILTANDRSKISPFFLDRPSRIRYCIEYDRLDLEIVEEVLKDILIDKNNVNDAISILSQLVNLTFDTVTQFAKECNTFPDKQPRDLANIFNISPQNSNIAHKYDVLASINGISLSQVLQDIIKSTYNVDCVVSVGMDYCVENTVVQGNAEPFLTIEVQEQSTLKFVVNDIEAFNIINVAYTNKGISFSEDLTATGSRLFNQFANIFTLVKSYSGTDKEKTSLSAKQVQEMLLQVGSTIDYKLIPKKPAYRFTY